MRDKTILVIGGGITGVAAAEWLRRDGHAVTLIDPVQPGDPDQASFGNAGLFARTAIAPVASPGLVRKAPLMVFDRTSPLFLRWSYLPRLLPWLIPFIRNARPDRMAQIAQGLSALVHDTNEQHFALARGTGAEAHIERGDYISLYRSRADYEADTLTIDIRRQNGLEPTPLSREDLLARDPHLGADYNFGTAFSDSCWLTSPSAYVRALFDHFMRQGGTFRQARVMDVTPGGAPKIVLEGGETLHADKIVLTAGAWSVRLARAMGVRVNMDTERGYHLSMYGPSFSPPQPYMVTDGKFVVTPMNGFLRAAGVVEFAGLDAPAIDAPLQLIRSGVKRLYPDLSFERAEPWMGRRPTTPDSLPVIGESARAPGILHAYGGQHVGLTMGPKLGRLMSDMVAGRHTNMDLAPYRVDRF